MDERALQFRVGAMVVGSVLIAVLLLIIFNFSPSLLRGRTTLYIKFAQAPGVTQDTPIRKSGVLIGRVTDVALRERDVIVTAKIDRKYNVYENETCRIGSETLLGDSMIEFAPGPVGQLGEPLADGALLEGHVKLDAVQAVQRATQALEVVARLEDDMATSMDHFRETTAKFGRLADHLNVIATKNEDQLSRVINKSEAAMDTFQVAMRNVNQLVGNDQLRHDLQQSLAGVPQLIDETRAAVKKYGAVAERAERSLIETEKFAKSLGQLGSSSQQMQQNVDQIAEKLDRLILDLLNVSDAINKQEGTIGQLVYNPELYQRLNRAADNVEQVSKRLRPIAEDVRVFTDKIARDPSRLGLKGALQNNQTGSKFSPFDFFYRQSTPQPGGQYHWAPTAQPGVSPQPHFQGQRQPLLPRNYPVRPTAHYRPAVGRNLPTAQANMASPTSPPQQQQQQQQQFAAPQRQPFATPVPTSRSPQSFWQTQ